MAILIRGLAMGALVATGCYEPRLADCVVGCTAAADCAPGHVCGSDGMCAAPDIAGSCAAIVASIDAGTTDARPDAPMIDAPIDAAVSLVQLRIEIADRGGVTVQNIGSCHHSAPGNMCTIHVPSGTPRLLTAVADPGYRFEKWETGPCNGEDATCTITPTAQVTHLKVKFKRDDDDDDDD